VSCTNLFGKEIVSRLYKKTKNNSVQKSKRVRPSPMKGFFPQECWENCCYNQCQRSEHWCEKWSFLLYHPYLQPERNSSDNYTLCHFHLIVRFLCVAHFYTRIYHHLWYDWEQYFNWHHTKYCTMMGDWMRHSILKKKKKGKTEIETHSDIAQEETAQTYLEQNSSTLHFEIT
jgi:hypothetical protein